MDSIYTLVKEKKEDREREREKEKEREKDKEREREMEMEAALYTNCLLLGLDASVLGQGGMLRSGLFRHSNPRMGENLLYFLLSALRGPAQSAKDFAGVWPIFDAGQSRDFRKIVQNLINELEAQGALPRSNSRVSSLATCCGQRFVELLWQLSAHALREVHKRSFPADVSANSLPASLTEIATQTNHASALLTVTKARIGMERRRFIDGATAAVRKQALWSSFAHDMTAEFRALCAEEAYLHQELEKLQEPKNHLESQATENSGRTYKSLSVSRASQHWESLMKETVQHERLVSGPIEDLIAHREHRYRVSGPALKAALDRSSGALSNDFLSPTSEETGCNDRNDGTFSKGSDDGLGTVSTIPESHEANHMKSDEKSVKGSSPIDVAEILRRWTHSLQRIHKQSTILARSNDGAGSDLIKETCGDGDNDHAQALRAIVAEHKQHMANIQLLINQLRDCMPGMEASISSMREQLSQKNPHIISLAMSSPLSESLHSSRDDSSHIKPRASCLELIPPSPAVKLPPIFSHAPGKSSSAQKACVSIHCSPDSIIQQESIESTIKEFPTDMRDNNIISSLRQEIHDAVLSRNNNIFDGIKPEIPECGVEHFFTPIEPFAKEDIEHALPPCSESKQSMRPSQEYHRYDAKDYLGTTKYCGEQHSVQEEDVSKRKTRTYKSTNKCLNYDAFSSNRNSLSGSGMEKISSNHDLTTSELTCPFSPPLLTELSSCSDTYEDLLGNDDFELSDVALEGVWFNPAM